MHGYVTPEYNKTAFNCPNCGAFAHQDWDIQITREGDEIGDISIALCAQCDECSVWRDKKMVFPSGTAPLPNVDLPDDVADDYKEAKSIAQMSPRGAAALLRLALQKLCTHLGGSGKSINDDIAALVASGLDPRIQKAFDVVRVIGNNAVHPGQLDLKDDSETVAQLFGLINLIAESMITVPKHVNALYDALPDDSKTAIVKRDGAKQARKERKAQ